MLFEFADKDLESLYYEGMGAEKYPTEVVDKFILRVVVIENAKDERDLRELKQLHFEKLVPKASGLYSIRLCGRWRLIFRFGASSNKDRIIVIQEISNHYGD